MASKQLHVLISTPHGIFLDEKADIVTFRTTEGEIGLMANATDFMAALVPSKIYINQQNSNKFKEFYIDKGIVQFNGELLSFIINEISDQPLAQVKVSNNEEENKKYTLIEEIKIKKALVK
ncbi:FoF1 ATP synthase subunit delta/epsilon [[Mycoplasma] anseris]|uniref:ATP synthase epsilon chain n=1 Tax=[Mycoplasma] anseris TaxID=92400 RepID=A0A2Z4NDK9_9BACT|nr:F0F1 ATP synthase subunit epsilon [[Mycoplasma] anseris]AWX69671.1 F0F1 ATP synthase subunit epsilon [[Mycoplasma] anseris]